MLTGENTARRFKVQLKRCRLVSVHVAMAGARGRNVMERAVRVAQDALPRGEREV